MYQLGSSSCLQDTIIHHARLPCERDLPMPGHLTCLSAAKPFVQSTASLDAPAPALRDALHQVAAVHVCACAAQRMLTYTTQQHTVDDPLDNVPLPLQARVKEQETQKKLFNIKRVVCIGGGVALVLVAWALLVASSSRGRVDPGRWAATLLSQMFLACYMLHSL